MAEYKGAVESIVFRNEKNGFTVASVKLDDIGRLSAVGVMPFINAGERCVFTGELGEHRDYGKQLNVESCVTVMPEKKSDIERYLASGVIKGVGPATASLIVAHFGRETMSILESQPGRLAEIPGIGPNRARSIGESFAQNIGQQRAVMFLQGLGLSPALSGKICQKYGDMTESAVRQNPYRLADDIDGVGFRTADDIALSLGFSRESKFRLMSGIRYALREAVLGDGHTYLPYDALMNSAERILNADPDPLYNAFAELVVDGQLVTEEIGGETAVYLPRLLDAENKVALMAVRLIKSASRGRLMPARANEMISEYESEASVELCGEQREAVLAAAFNGVTIITGGPGTGKTTSIRCLIHLLSCAGKVELCAPTGRAAKRMSEATGEPARTLHRLLEYQGDEEGFNRDEQNPLDADAVIVDEASMIDIFLMRALLRAIKPGSRLVLVGDADQLPSVGAGNVLRDCIDSGVIPVARLTEIFRQAAESRIITNAHRINSGQYPEILTKDTDFFLERKETASQAAQSVVALVNSRLPKYMALNPLRDIQVMAPMKKGDVGVRALNAALQAALNPPSKEKNELRAGENIFRAGDKIMQTKNNYDLKWQRAGEEGDGVFNGDIGFIKFANPAERTLTIEFDDGRIAEYESAAIDELDLAYCVSVHKSQGSEFDAVVMPLISGPPMLMTRNLLYTAVTRAKKLVVLVGREGCVRAMVDNNHIQKRYSALAPRLAKARG